MEENDRGADETLPREALVSGEHDVGDMAHRTDGVMAQGVSAAKGRGAAWGELVEHEGGAAPAPSHESGEVGGKIPLT